MQSTPWVLLINKFAFPVDGASGGSLSNIPYMPPKKHRIELLASLDQQTICSQRGYKCKEHTGEDDFLDYFCVTHDASLCLQCVREGHSECSLITMEVKTEENRRTLQEQADKLRRQERLLREVKGCWHVLIWRNGFVCLFLLFLFCFSVICRKRQRCSKKTSL